MSDEFYGFDDPDFEVPDELGPCSAHGRMNCLECYDVESEDIDE